MTQARESFFIHFCGEAVKGAGEDAWLCAQSRGCRIAAVFDGCGGLGSRKYQSEGGRTGAYLAARRAREVLSACAEICEEVDRDPITAIPELYGECLYRSLTKYSAELDRENGEPLYRGDMQKSLPTTVCAAIVGEKNFNCFWAGDSRIYLLSSEGLCVIAGDSGSTSDFDETFSRDRRLISYASADAPFSLLKKQIHLPDTGYAVLAVSDGVYAYFRTAMELEFALVDTLVKSDSPSEWSVKLSQAVSEYASDDFTLAAAVEADGGFEGFRCELSARRDYVYDNYISVLENADDEDETAAALWQQYRKRYLSLCRS